MKKERWKWNKYNLHQKEKKSYDVEHRKIMCKTLLNNNNNFGWWSKKRRKKNVYKT